VDTGLLNYFSGLQPAYYQHGSLHTFYRGVIAEHIVRQELMARDPAVNRNDPFRVREKKQSTAKVDLLLPWKGRVIPVEIKAGKAGTLRSLHQFMDRADHDMAVHLCAGNYGITKSATQSGIDSDPATAAP